MAVDPERFEAKIDRSGEHHRWLGASAANGVGQVRVDGKLVSAPRIAYELAHGPLPAGQTVLSCPDDSTCVRPDHLRVQQSRRAPKRAADPPGRSPRGAGSIKAMGPGVWKIGITAGVDEEGFRRRKFRTVRGTRLEATKALAALITEVGDGGALPRQSERSLTVEELVRWYLQFATEERGLEHSTMLGYETAYDNWVSDMIGNRRASTITPGDLDTLFGRMRRAGLSRSRMNNVRSVLSGAYKWGKRHRKVTTNPVQGFDLPVSTHTPRPTTAPELDALLHVLDIAEQHDPVIAPVLKLGATTGLRRGELAGLRRDRVRLDRNEIVVDTAVNDAGGLIVEKQTKTRQRRTLMIDEATVGMLRAHLKAMDDRAELLRTTVAPNAFVFSLDPDCSSPMRPEFLTRRMRQLRKDHNLTDGSFDATILALRKWTSSELMDAGFNPAAVSGRQGHTVQVMLHHYSTRRRSADQAAAEHLGAQVHRRSGV